MTWLDYAELIAVCAFFVTLLAALVGKAFDRITERWRA
jgi:hypothetical protein